MYSGKVMRYLLVKQSCFMYPSTVDRRENWRSFSGGPKGDSLHWGTIVREGVWANQHSSPTTVGCNGT